MVILVGVYTKNELAGQDEFHPYVIPRIFAIEGL
jgi:hypothetical protein